MNKTGVARELGGADVLCVTPAPPYIGNQTTPDHQGGSWEGVGRGLEGKGEGGPSMWDYRGEEAARGFDNNLLGGPPIGPSPCT